MQAIVSPSLAGRRFSPFPFSWCWTESQLIARATGGCITDPRDRPRMMPDTGRPAHPMVFFNAALRARNRPEVMESLIGGYEAWQKVGRWGAAECRFVPAPGSGRGVVESWIGAVGRTSKGHATVRFEFRAVADGSGEVLAEGNMLLFLLGRGAPDAPRLPVPAVSLPPTPPETGTHHCCSPNVSFDWAMASGDWNRIHFEAAPGAPAPLAHGPRNVALVISDVARALCGGEPSAVREVRVARLPAPHYLGEPTRTEIWPLEATRAVARLVVPAASRIDGGEGDKVVIDGVHLTLDAAPAPHHPERLGAQPPPGGTRA